MRTHDVRRLHTVSGALGRLPRDRPFTTGEAAELGVRPRVLRALVEQGLVVRPVRGVYHRAGLDDTMALRIAALALAVPAACAFTDLTAAWAWAGDRVLPPGAHLEPPLLSAFCPPGYRLRNVLTASGERGLNDSDVCELGGVRLTTPLRTACDVGRLEHRDLALGVMDAMAATGTFSAAEIVGESERFKGYRGVVQLRTLGPLVDRRSDSIPEATLRLRWMDAGLPKPDCQVPVSSPRGGHYLVDIGLPDERFGAEYFGERYHGEDRREHDDERLEHVRRLNGWHVVVARKHHVYGAEQDVIGTLRSAARARGIPTC